MVRITEDLIRKRSEHNECLISTLEELSLHQQDIERIEYLDKWCRDLKILYLQSNLIPKIENVGRLKKLEYLNLALNNIERIENLEGCESLNKLDLTVNFVGELTSVESLRNHCHLKELFLTGNPCCDFEGYREYVIATLPQLQTLDGFEVEKSERILALQILHEVRPQIIVQQKKYHVKREAERATENESNANNNNDSDQVNELDEHEREQRFWHEPTAYTPESRIKVHQHMEEEKQKRENRNKPAQTEKQERRLQMDDGQMLNVNDAKVDFTLTEDEEGKNILLDVAVFRFMDTELCDADVQPTYVRITIKGKILQIVLPEEVHPMQSNAQRSLTTGHLLITMPKVKPVLKVRALRPSQKVVDAKYAVAEKSAKMEKSRETLEVNTEINKLVDFANIVSEASVNGNAKSTMQSRQRSSKQMAIERPNSDGFVDNPDVPPLL